MNACILTIGDEILNGTTIDTNSAFIAQQSAAVGLKIANIFSVADTYEGIFEGLKLAENHASVIFITGGLGPTKDDITKKALADYFKQELVFNETVFETIKAFFEKRGKVQVELNKKLAYIPENCELIENSRGTAFGMWFKQSGTTYISMPGVPYEMKTMLAKSILPKLVKENNLPVLIDKYIMTAGIGESAIYEKIMDIEAELPMEISLAYLPKMGSVRLRLSGIENSTNSIDKEMEGFRKKISDRLEKYIYSFDGEDTLEKVVGNLLKEKKQTLATAESCTGGFIAHQITKIAGSSAYYEGSVIAYSYAAKEKELGVKKSTLEKFGAVSEEVVIEMVSGLLSKFETSYGIAVSGIAGPGGGLPDKPVGTVWLAIGNKQKVITKKLQLTTDRDINIRITSVMALNYLRRFISAND